MVFGLAFFCNPGQVILSSMKSYTLKLDSMEVGQLLDGLSARAEAWRRTAEFLANGEINGGPFIIEECSDADEAEAIASDYRAIIEKIRNQVREQE